MNGFSTVPNPLQKTSHNLSIKTQCGKQSFVRPTDVLANLMASVMDIKEFVLRDGAKDPSNHKVTSLSETPCAQKLLAELD